MNKKDLVIYLITNTVNGKQYVGQTTQKLSRRWQDHCRKASRGEGYAISSAIRYYGKDNFSIEKLDTALDIDSLNNKEIFYIKKLNTLTPNGYNISAGGRNSLLSCCTKKKLSDYMRNKLKNDPEYRNRLITRSKELQIPIYCYQNSRAYGSIAEATKELGLKSKSKITDILNKKLYAYNGFVFSKIVNNTIEVPGYIFDPDKEKDSIFGKFDVETFKKTYGNIATYQSIVKIVPIYCYQTNTIYKSIKDAGKELNLKSSSKISRVLLGKSKSYNGYTFAAIKEDGTYMTIEEYCLLRSKKSKIQKTTPEQKKKQSQYMKEKLAQNKDLLKHLAISNEKSKIKVTCHQNNKTYNSIRDASKDLNLKSHSKISDIINGNIKSYRGYTFSKVDNKTPQTT